MADVAGPRTVSLVLPVHNQADHITGVVESYVNVAGRVGMDVDFILVANACTDGSPDLCRQLARRYERVHVIEQSSGGWGRAVRAGLASADGELLGYTNCARTSPEILALTLSYARAYPGVVIKANRRVRDSLLRRTGSLLYNLECRALFDLATWDVNGTPKLFPRSFHRLRELRSARDLLDAEVMLVCRQQDYPVLEVPLLATTRLGGRSTTNLRSALRMYRGAAALRLRERR
jgi:glycosyltransferase involved in cell wall biosynthesis